MNRIIGIESSCDDTAVGVVDNGSLLANIVFSQDHSKFGGVYPEYASREHLSKISSVYNEALKAANLTLDDIDVIAATFAPGLVGALLVGYSFGKSLALSSNKKFIPVHHIKGHIYAAMLENKIEFPALALVASGGHTSLILVNEHHQFKEIACTLDDAVGEAYDKVGRMLGLSFPAGREIDELSKLGEANIDMPVYKGDGFSFSGLKSFVYRYLESNNPKKENVAASFQKAVEDSIVPKAIKEFEKSGAKSFILAGGVAANSGLRAKLSEKIENFYAPSIKLCLDNGAMIAAAAHYMIQSGQIAEDVMVKPTLKLEEF